MRLIKILILILSFQTFTQAFAQTKVTMDLRTNNFEKVLEEIKAQTIYHFVYNENSLPKQRIRVKAKNKEALTVLQQVLSKTNFTCTLLPNHLIAISEIKIDSAANAALPSKPLNEVVITALNIAKKDRKVGYAITTIKGEELAKARESNFSLSLEGKVAGLNVSGTSGGPSSSSRLLLRGAASMNAGSPLFILNGVPIDNTQRGSPTEYGGADYGDGISNLNVDDIESVTVLKGSAASALYGARAANGVILVTTKSGSKNAPPSIEYNMNLTFDQAVNNTDYQYIYGQGSQNLRPNNVESAIASGLLSWGEKMDGQPVVALDGKSYLYAPVKDNIRKFYRIAPALTNSIAISGGNTKAAFRLSASNLDYSSIVKNSKLSRKNFSLNVSYDVTAKLNVNFNGSYINEQSKNRSYLSDGPLNPNYGIQFLATSLNQALLAPGYHPVTGVETEWNNDAYKTNPYFAINKQVDDTRRNRFISATTAKYSFSKDISLQGRLGYDISNDHLLNVVPSGTAFTVNQQGALNALKEIQTYELNTDILFSAKKELSSHLEADVSAGANFRRRRSETLGYIGAQFIIPYLYTPSNLVSINSTYTIAELVTQSAYYTADLSFNHYLSLSTTGRYDVYSTLSANNRGIFVPGISGSFVFSDLLSVPQLNYGKLRMSFAKTSGEPALPYATQTYFSTDNSVNGIPMGNFSRILPNLNLKPFVLNEFETGVNMVLLNSRLSLDLTYFHRITNNEITNVEQSVTTGFTSSYVNLGKTRNTGLEVLLSAVPFKNKNSKWDIALNLSHVNNKLLAIDGTSKYILTGKYRPLNANTAMVVGQSITQIVAYDYKRDKNGNVIIDNTGIPERGDFKPMGGTLPTYYGGLTNTFQYKNFSLSFLVDFKFGNKVLSASENYSYVYGLNKATLEGRETGVVAKGVLEDGSVNTINVPAYSYYPQLAANISALSVLNGSYIKFRQFTLGYHFVPRNMKVFKSISVDLVGRNLFTLLKYTHNIDPESQFSPSLNYAGIEGSSLPLARTIGINLNFKLK